MRRLLVSISIAIALILITAVYLYFQRRAPEGVLYLYGNIDVRQVDIGFRVLGRVDSLLFEEGDRVPKGTLMATLDKQPYLDQVREAKATIGSVKANLENAEKIYERRKSLVNEGGVSLEDFETASSTQKVYEANLKEAEAALGVAQTNLNDTEVYAPNDGFILTRIREPGSVVIPGDGVYTLSIISPVWVRAFITEPNLGLIFPGMAADIFTDITNGKVYRGHIGFISPVAEFTPKTVETTQLRTELVYRLRVIVDNPDNELRQGMPVTVKLYIRTARETIERDSG